MPDSRPLMRIAEATEALAGAAANGVNLAVMIMEVDSTGTFFFPINSCSVVDTQGADGNPATTTLTDPFTGNQFRKTYTYVNGVQTAESAWVKL